MHFLPPFFKFSFVNGKHSGVRRHHYLGVRFFFVFFFFVPDPGVYPFYVHIRVGTKAASSLLNDGSFPVFGAPWARAPL